MSDLLVKSVFDNQHNLIKGIMSLYGISRFDLDPTYGKGGFYKNGVPKPVARYDIDPQFKHVRKADCCDLTIASESIHSMIFDPPFIAAGRNKKDTGIIYGRFSKVAGNMSELFSFYSRSLLEFYRVLEKDGILVFKCQDVVHAGKNYFTHVYIYNVAEKMGFRPIDLFVLVASTRMSQWNMKKQRHARKYHCFFWVFRKI